MTKKISELVELVEVAKEDYVPIVDDSESGGTTKRADIANILSVIYPIGSIYSNATVDTNPGTLLGFGTWTAFGAGRVPVGFNSTETEFNEAEKEGGAKTHTLTIAQMPEHQHSPPASADIGNFLYRAIAGGIGRFAFGTDERFGHSGSTGKKGGGGAHNNLQPYITVYMWKRTA